MKYLVPIDLSQNELQNPRMQNLASAPSGPVVGQFYFNTANKKAYVWNGTAWIAWEADTSVSPATTAPKMDGTAAVGTSAKYAREDHVHPTDTSRVPTTRKVNGKALSSDITIYSSDIAVSSSDSTTVSDSLGNKVDKVSGKGLSTNDYTTAEKNKLAGIASGAEVNVQSDWTQTTTTADDYIKNKPTLGTAAAKNFDTTVTANSSNLITSGAVASAIGAADAMRFKGTIGTGGTVTTLPTSGVKVGDTYRVIAAGTYAGEKCEVGDLIIAITTTPTWTVAQTNIDGAITSISGTAPISVTGSGSSRTVAISAASGSAAGSMSSAHYTKLEGIESGAQKNPTYTAVTGKPTANQTPGFGSTFTISQISQAASGQISATDRTVKIPNATATITAAGLMSATDKSVLDNLKELTFALANEETLSAGETVKTIDIGTGNSPCSVSAYDANGDEVAVDVQRVDTSSARGFQVSIASAVSYDIKLIYSYVPIG